MPGILRDKSFAKMSVEDFRAVVDVHLIGSAICTKAVWETMREQAYGRILMTSSSTGLYGNFGQANYGAAKIGLVGFAKTLHLEGAKYDIRVNTLAPTAATRMTEDLFPPELLGLFNPENVVPAALYLVSRGGADRTRSSAPAAGSSRRPTSPSPPATPCRRAAAPSRRWRRTGTGSPTARSRSSPSRAPSRRC